MGFLGPDGMMARRKSYDSMSYGQDGELAPPDPGAFEDDGLPVTESTLLDESPDAPAVGDALSGAPLPDPGPGELPDMTSLGVPPEAPAGPEGPAAPEDQTVPESVPAPDDEGQVEPVPEPDASAAEAEAALSPGVAAARRSIAEMIARTIGGR